MFWKGFGTGLADATSDNIDAVNARLEKQMEDARQMHSVYQKRRSEADQVKTKIKQSASAYGVPENVMINAYKNGHLDAYLKLIEKAKMKPGGDQLDGSQLASWYEVPSHMLESTGNLDAELNSIFGILERGVDDSDEIDNPSLGRMLFRAIGGDQDGMLQDNARRRQVKGISVEDLLGMPDPANPEPTGGEINYSGYTEQFGGEDGPAQLPQEWSQRVDALTGEVFGRILEFNGGQFNPGGLREALENKIKNRVIDYVRQKYGSEVNPSFNPEDIDLSDIIVADPETGGAWFRHPDRWALIDQNGRPTGQQRSLDDPPGAAPAEETDEEPALPPEGETTTPAPAAAPVRPTKAPPPKIARNGKEFTLVSAEPQPDGAFIYRAEDGEETRVRPRSAPPTPKATPGGVDLKNPNANLPYNPRW